MEDCQIVGTYLSVVKENGLMIIKKQVGIYSDTTVVERVWWCCSRVLV